MEFSAKTSLRLASSPKCEFADLDIEHPCEVKSSTNTRCGVSAYTVVLDIAAQRLKTIKTNRTATLSSLATLYNKDFTKIESSL